MVQPYLENFLYHFINRMPPFYILTLNRSSLASSPQVSHYAQGISAQCISFSNITHWSINKVILIGGKPVYFSLNRSFIEFQHRMKHYSRFLLSLRTLRVLRKREETGKTPRWRPPPTGATGAISPCCNW
jgi:hypothetical protein